MDLNTIEYKAESVAEPLQGCQNGNDHESQHSCVEGCAPDASSDTRPCIAIIARLPPPTNGATLVTSRVRTEFGKSMGEHVFNVTCRLKSRFAVALLTILRSVQIPVFLLRMRFAGVKRLYMVPDDRNGLYGNVVTAVTGRLFGMRCFLHHHGYTYIDRFDWRMALIDWVIGCQGVHITLGKSMSAGLKSRYHSKAQFVEVGNYFMMEPITQETSVKNMTGTLRLGLLSNLSEDKGLMDAVKLMEVLRARGCQAKLVLAGPCVDSKSKQFLEEAMRRNGDAIEYRGFVAGQQKVEFYSDIDVFIFPTHWRAEAQPLVILEALSNGCPVLTFARGCIEELLGGVGYAFPRGDDFTSSSLEILERWVKSPSEFAAASRDSIQRAKTLASEGEHQLSDLIHIMVS